MSVRFAEERRIVAAVWRRKTLWLLHLIANAMGLLMIYWWLGIPDRTVTDLVLSGVSGLAIAAFILWFQAATLAYFRLAHEQPEPRLRTAFAVSARSFPAFTVWAAILVAVLWITFQLSAYEQQVSNWTASMLTLRLRRPVSPATMSAVFSWGLIILTFVVMPLLLLPWGERTAGAGFRGFHWDSLRSALKTLVRFKYWLVCVALVVIGIVLPYGLVWWTPAAEGVRAETASISVRFVVAYALAVMSWLLLASTLGLRSSAEARRQV